MRRLITIRLKFQLLVSLLIFIISLFIYLYCPGKFEKQAINSLHERAISIAEITSYSVSPALVFNDRQAALESLNLLKNNSDITYAVVVDKNGDIFSSYRHDNGDMFQFDRNDVKTIVRSPMHYQLTMPVAASGQKVGYVILGFSLRSIQNSVVHTKKMIALFSIHVFLFGIITVMVISSIITQPLRRMMKTVRRIEEGDLTQRAEITSHDEFAELGQSFNTMVESLEASYSELASFNRKLEIRVNERTDRLNREINVRMKAEADLIRAKEYAERLFDLTPFAIFSVNKEKRIMSWNRKAAEITGFSSGEVLGQPCSIMMSENCRRKCRLFDNEEIKPIKGSTCTMFRKNGEKIIISKQSNLLNNEHGDIIGGIECFEDITYRRQLEEELQRRQRMDSLGNLAGGIAHDFNNLLMGIMGNLDMLKLESEAMDAPSLDYVDESYRLCNRAAKLTQRIQTLTRSTITQRDNVDIHRIATDVFSILDRTTDKLIEMVVDMEPGRFFVYANEDQLHQVLLNLGTNSVNAFSERATRQGGFIRITAEEHTSSMSDATGLPDGDYIHIMFADNGRGMNESIRKRAFDPLFTTRQKGSKKGQGLGLAMVYTIVTNNHGGYVHIESTPRAGTTVHIYLTKGERTEQQPEIPDTGKTTGSGTLLVVEDEEAIRTLIRQALEKAGYSVLTAVDGLDGLDRFSSHADSIDLVLLDLTMPRMSGSMLFDRIKSLRPDTRVIILSGHSEEEIFGSHQADAFLMKPFRIQDLLATVASGVTP